MPPPTLQRVLYVEDEPDIRKIARVALERIGRLTVLICDSGAAALREIRAFKPDLVVLDVMMPDMDGPAVLRALREEEATRSVPVVFMTARVQPQETSRYLSLGAVGVIAKPFDPATLSDELRKLWHAAHA